MIKELKKITAVFLCICMLVPLVTTVTSFAANSEPTITVSGATVCAGNEFTVDVVTSANPGISAFTFSIDYDTDNFTLDSVSVNPTLGGQSNFSKKLVWFTGQNITFNGTIFTLSFTAKEDTATGDYDVSVSYNKGDICDIEENDIDFEIIPGKISVVDVLAGDINGDNAVNSKDLTRLLRYTSGEEVTVIEQCLDVNGDGNRNSKDLTRLMKFISGEDVEIFPKPSSCRHTMTATEAKEPTCTEVGNTAYWYCNKCCKYFSDEAGKNAITLSDTVIAAKGHTVVIDEAVKATYEHDGLTQGSHCSVCNTIIVERKIVPKLTKDTGSIIYYYNENDTYLFSHLDEISNSNEDFYYVQDGLTLSNQVKLAGYTFDGWYDGFSSTATKITKIPAGTTGTVELYAHFEKDVYELTLSDSINGDKTINFTVDKGASLGKNPEWAGYNFIGWCNSDDKLVTSIPVGTIGDQKLYANWTSKRNQTRPVSTLGDPIVLEDVEKGEILFTYEIGTIENIPLNQISDIYQNTKGMKQTFTTTEEVSVSESNAKEIANSISNATVNSSSWSLSKEWNDVTSVNESYAEGRGWSKEEAETKSKTSSNTYSMNSSSGGSSSRVTNTGISGTLSADRSDTSSSSVSATREIGVQLDISANNSSTIGAGGEISGKVPGVGKASGSVNVSNTLDIGASFGAYGKAANSETLSASTTGSKGASLTQNSTTTTTGSSSWNSSSGYSNSQSITSSESVVNVLSGTINEVKNYGSSHAIGGSNSENFGCENSSTENNEYTSSVTYNTSTIKTNTKTVELGGESEGYYRYVLAGTAHVFAVVGYDIASRSYYVFTYSVMDDNTYTFIDYSKETANFNDNEFGVLPFEIPFLVKNYVDYRVGYTNGLQINTSTGMIDSYNGTEKNVFVPAYMSVENIDGNGNPGVVKINGFSSSAFANNTNIEGISLGGFVVEIPENAFRGCTSLKQVVSPGITKIGKDAFKDCISLDEFIIPKEVELLDENAFNNISMVYATASNSTVADNTVKCGAKKIVLNIATPDTISGNYVVPDTTQYFEIQGGNKTYSDIMIESNADSTYLNGLNIDRISRTPLKIDSSNLTLNGVNVKAVGLGLILTSNSVVSLRQENSIESISGKAILSKNIDFNAADSNVTGAINVTGDILHFGQHTGNDFVVFKNGRFVSLTEYEYNQYLNGLSIVSFDANGGECDVVSKEIFIDEEIGELPVPTKEGYTFDGWYTQSAGGSKVNSSTCFTTATDVTLYAHWTANSYIIEWDIGIGYTVLVNRTSSPNKGAYIGVVSNGATVYYGDVLSVTYEKEDYYSISTTGKTVINVTDNVTSSDIYAVAELNPLSDWTKITDTPSDANIEETKWDYKLKTTKTSSSSTLSGYTFDYREQTGWGAWSNWLTWNPSNGERDIDYNPSKYWYTEYHYYRYKSPTGYGVYSYPYSNYEFQEIWIDHQLPHFENSSDIFVNGSGKENRWFEARYAGNRYCDTTFTRDIYTQEQWRYRDPIYTYHFYKFEDKSTTIGDPTGQTGVSDVVTYVRYREK